MNVSEKLKQKIDSYYSEIRRESPFMVNARLGKVKPEGVAHFVRSARFLVEHTPIHLALASRIAIEKDQPHLANFFRDKIEEERGHDQWAADDLERLHARWDLESDQRVSDSIVRLVDYIKSIIEEDPAQYLAYILFSEYLTVIAGPELIANLEANCGIGRDNMTVIGNHAELDKEHVAEDFVVLESLVPPASYVERWEAVIDRAMHFHRHLIREAGLRGVA